jgi:hypothetical protein
MLTNEIFHIREETVPLAKLALYEDLQMRVKLPQATISEYAAAMRAGSVFDSIKCGEFEGELIVYDGFLRKMAYAKTEITHVRVNIRAAESRDQIVLWAVKANAYQFLVRSNADKQHSVLQLLNTEIGRGMSAVDIAHAAGVTPRMVQEYRKQTESKISNERFVSESSPKVKTARGLRPRKYRTKKERERVKSGTHFSPKIEWPTREQTGAPPPELENQPHPDHPGMTYSDVHVRQHGFVQLFSLDEKRRQDNIIAMRDIASLLRTIGENCPKLIAARTKASSLPDLLQLLGTKEGSVSLRKINLARNDLDQALPLIREFLDATLAIKAAEPVPSELKRAEEKIK